MIDLHRDVEKEMMGFIAFYFIKGRVPIMIQAIILKKKLYFSIISLFHFNTLSNYNCCQQNIALKRLLFIQLTITNPIKIITLLMIRFRR